MGSGHGGDVRGEGVERCRAGVAACAPRCASPPRLPCSPPAPATIRNFQPRAAATQSGAQAPGTTIGAGQVRVGLILPLSAQGNAGVAAQSMKNAAEMALAEFKNPNIQLLVKDDGGTPQGAQAGAQQAIDEGAEIIIGPLFAEAVSAVGAVARQRGIPVIAFSTDASVAARGVYLLSFLPESDVKRIVDFAVSRGKRSFAALLPDNAYGTVVEAAFQQEVARRGGRVLALEKYPLDPSQHGRAGASRRRRRRRRSIRSSFPTAPTRCRRWCRRSPATASTSSACNCSAPGCGTIRASSPTAALDGGWYAAPESAGFRNFSGALSRPIRPGPGAHGDARL